VVNGHVALVTRCPGHTTATAHASRGANWVGDGAATDAGANAAISIANTIATLRQIDASNNATVRIVADVCAKRVTPCHSRSGVGILRTLMMTCIGEPPAWAGGMLPSAVTS
jgi:hypothetical protein